VKEDKRGFDKSGFRKRWQCQITNNTWRAGQFTSYSVSSTETAFDPK